MKNIRELLRDADPLRHEPMAPSDQRHLHRQAILAAGSSARGRAGAGSRWRIAVLVSGTFMVIVALFLGARTGSLVLSDVHAAVRFEVRLAEDKPAPGLRVAKVSDSGRLVYLHDEIIVTNSDIESARVIQGSGPSQYGVAVEFNASGAEKMRAATGNRIGKPMAILLDGEVAMAPVIRTAIGPSALITGKFTRTQAEKIANGIRIQ
jgi:hypothetical protein